MYSMLLVIIVVIIRYRVNSNVISLKYYFIQIKSFRQMLPQQRPDHPHHAAVHLMKALKCCEDCSEGDDKSLLEIRQLEFRKEILADQLRRMPDPELSISALKSEIHHLQSLVNDLSLENQQAYQFSQQEIDRHQIQLEKHKQLSLAEIDNQLVIQINLTKSLTIQFEALVEKVRSLNRINNELIYNFCGSG